MTTYNPPRENVPIFDSSLFVEAENSSFTQAQADLLYVHYPFAQGPVTFQGQSNLVIPTCSAVQPAPTDNSTKIPTTAWVQSAITSLPPSGVTAGAYTNTNLTVNAQGIITLASNGTGSNVLSTQTFISNANITLPVGTQFVTLMVSGAGGASGGAFFDPTVPSVTAGGAGGGGGCAIITRLPMEAGTNLVCAFTNSNGTCSVGYAPVPNTPYTFSLPLITANAGAGGVTAVSTGGNPAGGAGGTISVGFTPMGYGLTGGAGGAGQQSSTTYAILQGINLLSTVNQNMVLSTITTPFNYGAGGFTRINNGSTNNVTINNPGSAVCIVISYSS